MSVTDKDQIRQTVHERYAGVANDTGSCCSGAEEYVCSAIITARKKEGNK